MNYEGEHTVSNRVKQFPPVKESRESLPVHTEGLSPGVKLGTGRNLANIALDGFENLGSNQRSKKLFGSRSNGIRGIRYADDAVFICKPGADIQLLRRDIDEWLKQKGLKINEAKTKVSKATEGFDFLGWHFRVNSRGTFKSTPSKESHHKIKDKIRATWKRNASTEARIKLIASQVRGWRNYHNSCDMGGYNLWSISHWLWKKLRKDKAKQSQKEAKKELSKKKAGSAAKTTKPTKSTSSTKESVHKKQKGADKRVLTNFQIQDAFPKVEWSVNSHVMVKGTASPFDGNLAYWVKRKAKEYKGSLTGKIMKKQDMLGEHCSHLFMPDDTVELHHRDGNHGNWNHKNLVALHRQCHQHQEVHKVRVKEGIAASQTKAQKGHRKINLGEPDERRYGPVLKRGALR